MKENNILYCISYKFFYNKYTLNNFGFNFELFECMYEWVSGF